MLTKTAPLSATGLDPVPTLLAHLETGNDVIRTDAIRALARMSPDDDRVHDALIAALLDEDPDVRSDAMDALAQFARPEDAEKIRENLIGDPVREVKLAAIDLLAQLNDRASIPLLRKLAKDRCEDEVAWEDEAGMWDEWLEVQIAAIRALGQMRAEEALQDMLAARDDEFGQNLDLPVFEALSQMGHEGMVWLLAVAQTETGLPRKRALEAMAKLDPDALRDHVDFLLGDDNAEVRLLALPLLSDDDDRVAYLALNDADISVQCQALAKAAPSRPDLAVAALSSNAPEVQAAALDHLATPVAEDLAAPLADNMQAWLLTDEGALATAVAQNWFRLTPEATPDPLLMIIRNADRPLEARVAAVDALATLDDEVATERLISLLANPAQQVRVVVLTHLTRLAETGDEAAIDALAAAAEGALIAPEPAPDAPPAEGTGDSDIPRLRITENGEVETTSEGNGTMSTLEAIQINRVAPKPEKNDTEGAAEKEGKKSGKKGQKRLAIEGPAEVGQDLSRVALGLIGQVPSDKIGTAIRAMTESVRDDLRAAAYQALDVRITAQGCCEADEPRLVAGLMDRTALIRSRAARMAQGLAAMEERLAACIRDDDPMVRMEAVSALTEVDAIFDCLGDDDTRVRDMAVGRIARLDDAALLNAAFERLLADERIASLRAGTRGAAPFLGHILSRLSDPDLSKRQVHVLLQAMAA